MAAWVYTVGDGYYYSHYQNTSNALNVKTYLESLGFSQAAIIGIVANMEHESYLNPGQQEHGYGGDPSRGYGLVQWTPASSKIVAYANSVGGNWYDGDIQMDYLASSTSASWIMTAQFPYTWDEYKNLTDIYTATGAFFYNFERGTWHNVLYDYASWWYEYLYGSTPPTPPEPPEPPTPIDEYEYIVALKLLIRGLHN